MGGMSGAEIVVGTGTGLEATDTVLTIGAQHPSTAEHEPATRSADRADGGHRALDRWLSSSSPRESTMLWPRTSMSGIESRSALRP